MALFILIPPFFFIVVLLLMGCEAQDSQLLTTQDSSTSSGFSLDLIHRDYSPLSPFYDPVATNFERLHNAIRRSYSRPSYLQSRSKKPSSSSVTIESEMLYDFFEYLIKFHIGTPPVEVLGVADTGSELTWIQCKPCKKCFEHIGPLFDLRASSTYKTLKCKSKQCKALIGHTGACTRKHNKCQYSLTYMDGSVSNGHLATERLTFGKTSIKRVAFGCGHYNQGYFGNISSGIVGLGGGHLSLISQLDETIQGKFSYCFVPVFRNETSTIIFGEKAQVSNSIRFSTPLFQVPGNPCYYLKLDKVFVGSKSFELPKRDGGGWSKDGNIIIDSGTTLTFLPSGTYYKFQSALKEAIGVEIIKDPTGFYDLCYRTSSNVKVPVISFQFKGAKLLKLPLSSTFLEVADDVTCLQVAPTNYSSIIGNLWQQNLLVSYDLHAKTVSFQEADCSKN